MREGLVDILRCPCCRAEHTLSVTADVQDEREIRHGRLTCGRCGRGYRIEDGIVNLLHDPPGFVTREARGLERFADVMRRDGWDRERILALPDIELGYWVGQGIAFRALLATVALRPGARILDVGANTCWASNIFARRGLDVIALDITDTELQGLRTADYFLDRGDVYFERLMSVMFDVALASSSVDYVFCSQVLHHNDPRNLRRTMREFHRILRPGGKVLVINEPLRFPLNLKRDHAAEVAEFEGYEHVYFAHQYLLAARCAGFEITVHEPVTDGFFSQWSVRLDPETATRKAVRTLVAHIARRHRAARRVMLAYKTLVAGDVALNMVATKAPALLMDCVDP